MRKKQSTLWLAEEIEIAVWNNISKFKNSSSKECLNLIKWVIEKEPNGKRPLGRPKLRWEDGVKKEVEKVEPGVKWREVAEDRDRWQSFVFSG
ncbi:hypothetical protein QTP88_015292 [Uroleucon formosanum]